jgi:hypothetical protein
MSLLRTICERAVAGDRQIGGPRRGEMGGRGRWALSRLEVMVELLSVLVVVVLGADHDLGPLLGEQTEYLRVEVAAVRPAMGR